MHFRPAKPPNPQVAGFVLVVAQAGIVASVAHAQIRVTAPSSQFEISETVQFDRADGAVWHTWNGPKPAWRRTSGTRPWRPCGR